MPLSLLLCRVLETFVGENSQIGENITKISVLDGHLHTDIIENTFAESVSTTIIFMFLALWCLGSMKGLRIWCFKVCQCLIAELWIHDCG